MNKSLSSFNFLPILFSKLKKTKKEYKETVSINVKYGTLTFSKQYIDKHNLDGSYLKFFADTSNSLLGWQKVKHTSFFPNLKDYKCIKASKSKIYLVSIRSLLKSFNLSNSKKSFKKLEIKKYSCTQSGIYNGIIEYVTLK